MLTLISPYLRGVQFWLPLVMAISFYIFNDNERRTRYYALLGLVVLLGVTLIVSDIWVIPGISRDYGVDLYSGMMMIVNILVFGLVMFSRNQAYRHIGHRTFFLCLFAALWGINAALASQQLFVFYIFSEIALIPLIVLWTMWTNGTKLGILQNFYGHLLIGSISIFAVLVYLASQGEVPISLLTLHSDLSNISNIPENARLAVFILLCSGFVTRLGVFPFHSWTKTLVHTAPISVSGSLLNGVFLMGIAGVVKFILPNFKEEIFLYGQILAIIAVVGIIYCALVAMIQPEYKHKIPYHTSMIASFILAGLFCNSYDGVNGAIYLTVFRSLSVVLLLLSLKLLNVETRVARKVFFVVVLLNVLLPLNGGFVGTLFIFSGMLQKMPVLALMMVVGFVLPPFYFLGALKGNNEIVSQNKIITNVEKISFVLVCCLIFAGGILSAAWNSISFDFVKGLVL